MATMAYGDIPVVMIPSKVPDWVSILGPRAHKASILTITPMETGTPCTNLAFLETLNWKPEYDIASFVSLMISKSTLILSLNIYCIMKGLRDGCI